MKTRPGHTGRTPRQKAQIASGLVTLGEIRDSSRNVSHIDIDFRMEGYDTPPSKKKTPPPNLRTYVLYTCLHVFELKKTMHFPNFYVRRTFYFPKIGIIIEDYKTCILHVFCIKKTVRLPSFMLKKTSF